MLERIQLPRGMYVTIEVERDEDTQDPTEDMDMASIDVFEDQKSFWNFVNSHGWTELDLQNAVYGHVLISDGRPYMGLERYQHSGDIYALCRAGNFPDRRWDVSPIVGFISPHPNADSDVTGNHDLMVTRLNHTLEDYNHWLSGEVYGFIATLYDADGAQIGDDDSCWGFIGDEDYCLEEGKGAAYGLALNVLTKDEIQQHLEGTGELAEYIKDWSKRILNEEEQEGKPLSEIAYRLYHYISDTYLKNADARALICRVKDDEWGEYKEFPRRDWRQDVCSSSTNLGYWDWVSHKLEEKR